MKDLPPTSGTSVPPYWRVAFLALGLISLALGVAGGLARVSEVNAPLNAVALHGALMVSAFFGTVVSLERAVALRRLWAYAAPFCAGIGGLLLLVGMPTDGFSWMGFGAGVLIVASIALFRRRPSVERATLIAGAAAWFIGNVSVLYGLAAVPWWIAFFALAVGAARLEPSGYLKRGRGARASFIVLALALLAAPLEPRALGFVLMLLSAWLFRFDVARFAVRQPGLPRYAAVCLLCGYFWLAAGGLLILLEVDYDGALHAIFLGFAFSMVLGHAPVVAPAMLGVAFPYHAALYLPLALLQGSLVLRLFWIEAGAWGNAAAIAVFLLTAIFLVSGFDPRQRKSITPG